MEFQHKPTNHNSTAKMYYATSLFMAFFITFSCLAQVGKSDKNGNRQGKWQIYYSGASKMHVLQYGGWNREDIEYISEIGLPMLGGSFSSIPDYYASLKEVASIAEAQYVEECTYKNNVKTGKFILYRCIQAHSNQKIQIEVANGNYVNGQFNGLVNIYSRLSIYYGSSSPSANGTELNPILLDQDEFVVIYEKNAILDQTIIPILKRGSINKGWSERPKLEQFFVYVDGICIKSLKQNMDCLQCYALYEIRSDGTKCELRNFEIPNIPYVLSNWLFTTGNYKDFVPPTTWPYGYISENKYDGNWRLYYSGAGVLNGLYDTVDVCLEWNKINRTLEGYHASHKGMYRPHDNGTTKWPAFRVTCDSSGVLNGPGEFYKLVQTPNGSITRLQYRANFVNGYLDGPFEAYGGGGLGFPLMGWGLHAARAHNAPSGRFTSPLEIASSEEPNLARYLLSLHNPTDDPKSDVAQYGLVYKTNMVPVWIQTEGAKKTSPSANKMMVSYPSSSLTYYYDSKIIGKTMLNNNNPADILDYIVYDQSGAEKTSLLKLGKDKEDDELRRKKETENMLSSEINCAACSRTVILRNAHVNPTGSSVCTNSRGEKTELLGSLIPVPKYFCSLRCKMDYDKDRCIRNGYRYE